MTKKSNSEGGIFGDGSQDEMFEWFLKLVGYVCVVSIVIAIIIAITYFEIPLTLPFD